MWTKFQQLNTVRSAEQRCTVSRNRVCPTRNPVTVPLKCEERVFPGPTPAVAMVLAGTTAGVKVQQFWELQVDSLSEG